MKDDEKMQRHKKMVKEAIRDKKMMKETRKKR
jgi:hypothetical protein